MVNVMDRLHAVANPAGRHIHDLTYLNVFKRAGGIFSLVQPDDKPRFELDAYTVVLAAMDLDILMRRAYPLFLIVPRHLEEKRFGMPVHQGWMKIHPDGRANQHSINRPVSLMVSPALMRLGGEPGLRYRVRRVLHFALVLTERVQGEEEEGEEEEDVMQGDDAVLLHIDVAC